MELRGGRGALGHAISLILVGGCVALCALSPSDMSQPHMPVQPIDSLCSMFSWPRSRHCDFILLCGP